MTGHATKWPWRFPNWGFPGFSSVVMQISGNLLHCPQFPLHSIITLIIFPSATDWLMRQMHLTWGKWPTSLGTHGFRPKLLLVVAALGCWDSTRLPYIRLWIMDKIKTLVVPTFIIYTRMKKFLMVVGKDTSTSCPEKICFCTLPQALVNINHLSTVPLSHTVKLGYSDFGWPSVWYSG